MRLWHESLLSKLPRNQLNGQHRECCALRGGGWNKKHSTVNYIFEYSIERLVAYHLKVMKEMENRGYNPNPVWKNPNYRGKKCKELPYVNKILLKNRIKYKTYSEHNKKYLKECIANLTDKGCVCKYIEDLI